jgi:predicted aspartyl protease
MIRLEINYGRRNIGVKLYVWNKTKGKFEEIYALFDTGAHTCSIDSDVLQELGYSLDKAQKSYITTATKTNEAVKRVRVDKIMLDGTEIESVLFNTFEFPLVSHQIILGMNVIRNFEVNMNFKKQLITMSENYLEDGDDHYDTDTFGDWRADIK